MNNKAALTLGHGCPLRGLVGHLTGAGRGFVGLYPGSRGLHIGDQAGRRLHIGTTRQATHRDQGIFKNLTGLILAEGTTPGHSEKMTALILGEDRSHAFLKN
jgi:hypothetical protein